MYKLKDRLRAAGIHFGISAVIAALSALLVFWLWYPWPYREISSGRELFFIVVTVDVILGPLLTFAVFDMRKGLKKMRFDFAVIALLQLTGLSYGLWTVFIARPVHLVFEYTMFRVVHAADIDPADLAKAPGALRALPVTGPTPLSLRAFSSGDEQLKATLSAVAGSQLSAQPALWQPYEAAMFDLLTKAKPLPDLYKRFAANKALTDEAVVASGRKPEELVWLPLAGRKTFWTVLVEQKTAKPVGYLPLDSF